MSTGKIIFENESEKFIPAIVGLANDKIFEKNLEVIRTKYNGDIEAFFRDVKAQPVSKLKPLVTETEMLEIIHTLTDWKGIAKSAKQIGVTPAQLSRVLRLGKVSNEIAQFFGYQKKVMFERD